MEEQTVLNLNKGMAMVGLAVAVAIFELLPLFIMRRKDSAYMGRSANLWLDHLLRAGGGVLVATTFIHLLPEVREGVEKLQRANAMPDWPVQIPELIMCAGFFLMYGTEELVHRCLVTDHSHECDGVHNQEAGNNGKSHVHVDPERPLRGILLVIAVSIHQVFEGAAVGLEKEVKQMWTLLGAVAAHKLIIAICVGAEILSGGAKFATQAVCLFVFAVASPTGVGLGMLMTTDGGSSVGMDFASTMLQGIATGTLMFVVFFEILSKSQAHGFVRITQYLATVLGFVIMLVLLWFIDS
uniref:Zinc transporter ZIP3 n=1 Tax=Lygus hesperus TaxID=30085 RepID=A0A0A9W1D2_LYGHE